MPDSLPPVLRAPLQMRRLYGQRVTVAALADLAERAYEDLGLSPETTHPLHVIELAIGGERRDIERLLDWHAERGFREGYRLRTAADTSLEPQADYRYAAAFAVGAACCRRFRPAVAAERESRMHEDARLVLRTAAAVAEADRLQQAAAAALDAGDRPRHGRLWKERERVLAQDRRMWEQYHAAAKAALWAGWKEAVS